MKFKDNMIITILFIIIGFVLEFIFSANWIIIVLSAILCMLILYDIAKTVYIIENNELIIRERKRTIRIPINNITYIQFNFYIRGYSPYQIFYKEFDIKKANKKQLEEYNKKGYFIDSLDVSKSIKNKEKKNLIDILDKQYNIKVDSIVFKDTHLND
jgi:hypothetical protein